MKNKFRSIFRPTECIKFLKNQSRRFEQVLLQKLLQTRDFYILEHILVYKNLVFAIIFVIIIQQYICILNSIHIYC